MKKLLAILLVLVFCFSLVACGGGNTAANAKIVEYVEKNEDELIDSMEQAFAKSSGMTCTSSIKVEDMGFIIQININELDNLDDSTKAQIQTTYDNMSSQFSSMLSGAQTELPELEYMEILVCERDGDKIANIVMGNK